MTYNKSQIMKTAYAIKKQNGVTFSEALKLSWSITKSIVAQAVVANKETNEVTAAQLRVFAQYGIEVSGLKASRKWTPGYNQCKQLLEMLDWNVVNRKLVYAPFSGEYTETLAEAYRF